MEKKQTDLSIISGYPQDVISHVEKLINNGGLTLYINNKYKDRHEITNDKSLYNYINSIKKTYMKKSDPIHKVSYDDNIDRVYKALGLNSTVSRKQGKNLKSKNEIKISSIFKKAPLEFLNMIVIHELAHIKIKEHNKEFYKLCSYMEPNYFQLEFDVRLYLLSL